VSSSWLLLAALAPAPTSTVEGPAEARVDLERTRDGGYRHRDDKARFEATIAADGSVKFRDLPAISDGSLTFLGFDLTGRGKRALVREGPLDAEGNQIAPDRIVNHGPYGPPPILLRAGGRFGGVADLRGGPTRKQAKAKFLERTQGLRDRLAAEARERDAVRALVQLAAELEDIWSDERLDVAARKRKIFALWDDCQEAELKAPGGGLGARARRRIEEFVLHNAPAGSHRAFTATELHELNARRVSRQRFDPYRRPTQR
jgi:hypothetical protein